MNLKVKYMRIEKKLTYNDREDNYDDNVLYILNCVEHGKYEGSKYEITLWTEYGDCYSGWCAASFGHGYIKKVSSFAGVTHVPISDLYFDLDILIDLGEKEINDVENNIFSLDSNGGDYYYPGGSATVNMELFKEINRNKEKRPVWVFIGDSVAGKSYLSTIIANGDYHKSVYETDAHENIDQISDDIIVIGNKYPYTLEDIKSHIIGEHEVILVDFKILQ